MSITSRSATIGARTGRALIGGMRAMTTAARVLMAVKAALAASLAWYLVPLLPFTGDEYSYYAPLGVLVVMYPTVAASARSGAQALIGLATGIGLGVLGVLAGASGVPGIVVLAAVVAVGVLFGALRSLGEGRSWVAISALFVLLLNNGQVESFSVSYLLNVAFGVIIGGVVNLVVIPPLYLRRASGRLSILRDALGGFLTSLADRIADADVDADASEAHLRQVDATAADVRAEVQEADDSRRANPRGRRHRAEQEENLARLQALDRSAFYARELAELLTAPRARVEGAADEEGGLGEDRAHPLVGEARAELARAARACGELVATPVAEEASPRRLREADAALAAYLAALERGLPKTAVGADALTPAVCLRRIIDACVPFVRD